jgi:hypothetical protein
MMPAMMDSHGKPGTAGRTIGVETEIVAELLVVVGVLTTVIVETETDVLTTVVGSELVLVKGIVEALEEVELATIVGVVVVATELDVELEFELAVVTCWPTTGGTVGSRWKMPDRSFVPMLGCAPTAHPSVGLVVKTDSKPNPEAIGRE